MKIRILLFVFSLLFMDTFGQIGFEEHIIVDQTLSIDGGAFSKSSDIDNDGDQDIISYSDNDSKLAFHENEDGLGLFKPLQVISTSYRVSSLYLVDLDADGDIDLLTSNPTEDEIIWHENLDGMGTFSEKQIIASNGSYGKARVADLDTDGDLDIYATSWQDDKLVWFENLDGLGNFDVQQDVSVDLGDGAAVNTSDVDGDGDLDLIVIYYAVDKISWFENLDGQGNFGVEEIIDTNVDGPSIVLSHDFDGDSDMDLLTYLIFDDYLMWYENMDGQGDFGAPNTIDSFGINGPDEKFYINDFDLDGDLDIATVLNHSLNWYENTDGQGDFSAPQVISIDLAGASSVSGGDINGDGRLNLITSSYADDKIAWYENGIGTFGGQQIVTRGLSGGLYMYISSSDLDGDSDTDVLTASFDDGKIAWYENLDGQGDFGLQKVIDIENGAFAVFPGDIDNDGDDDVIAGAGGSINWYENTDGQGDFGTENTVIADEYSIESIFPIDINGDGFLDILAGSYFGTRIVWFPNNNGVFGDEEIIENNLFGTPYVYSIDIDNDGFNDVFAHSFKTSPAEFKLVWYKNLDGQGNFSSEKTIDADVGSVTYIQAGDLDNDGDLDLYVIQGDIVWYENLDGLGTFGSEQIISTEVNRPRAGKIADIDNDGDNDLVSVSSNDDKMAWYENLDGAGNFGTQQIISLNSLSPRYIEDTDINGDGIIDLICISNKDSKLSWFENKGLVSNKILGKISLDINGNGCDVIDLSVPNIMVETESNTSSLASFSILSGIYQLFPPEGIYTTTIPSLPNNYTVSPLSYTSDFIGIGNTDTLDFCLTPIQIFDDLNITILPTSEARPGFNSFYQVVFHNMGTTQLSGNVSLTFDANKMTFLAASEIVTAQSVDALTFDYVDLNPFETRTIDLKFNILPPPTVNIEELLNFTATINPVAGDFTESDNVFELNQTVIGSYDPNDIKVLEGDKILIADADKYLHYIIRFQNTGTASAINVRVENILDDNLDWQTMQLESSSHPNRVEINDGNQLAFIFDGINLPDSTSNEPESNGFIAYKIKPKSDIQIGDIISSTADIYFDFNEAVVTNTATTEIVEPVSLDENMLLRFSIYPIPTSGILSIQSETNISQIEIFDRLGQLLLTNFNKKEIDLSSLNKGFYFCKIKDENGNSGVKKVVKE